MSGCLVASGGRFDWAQRAWGCVFGTARERGKSGRTPNHVSHGCWQLCAGAEFGSCLLRENVGWRDWTTHHGPVEGNVHLFVGMGVNGSQRSSLSLTLLSTDAGHRTFCFCILGKEMRFVTGSPE
jgi:hypothetical protein